MLLFRFNVHCICLYCVFIALRDFGGRRFISTVLLLLLLLLLLLKTLIMKSECDFFDLCFMVWVFSIMFLYCIIIYGFAQIVNEGICH